MSEALRTLIPFGFNEIEMHRIQASVFPENTASIRLLEKFGFQQEGILRQYTYIKYRDVWEDCLVMALLKNP
jgi:ribosomal-protein-alanine N-acetyltransferase